MKESLHVVHIYNSITQEIEAGRAEFKDITGSLRLA